MSERLAEEVCALFVEHSLKTLETMQGYTHACFDKLTDAQVWERGAEHENALGNLVLHLCGNMRQWILHGVARQPDVRERDAEFATDRTPSKAELLQMFDSTLAECIAAIANLKAANLLERTDPQKRGEVSVLDAVYQVVGHVQQHVGQIIWATKKMAGTDLGLSMPRRK